MHSQKTKETDIKNSPHLAEKKNISNNKNFLIVSAILTYIMIVVFYGIYSYTTDLSYEILDVSYDIIWFFRDLVYYI